MSLPTFTPAAAAALDGSEWLRHRRSEAAERFASTELPTVEEEIWRYSRIGELDLERFAPVVASSGAVSADDLASWRAMEPAALVVTVDGWLTHLEVDPAAAAAGLVVGLVDGDGMLGRVMTEPTDAFAVLNDAFCTAPLAVSVPRSVALERPVVVLHLVTTAMAATFPRLVVRAGENSEITVLEQFTSSGGAAALVAPVTELDAAPSARLRYLALNQLGHEVWLIGSLVSVGERDSNTTIASVALGGDYARSRIDAKLIGQGAHTEQIAVYFGEGDQMHDFRTLQDHAAPKTTSNLLFKGAVEGRSRSVYTGLIKVRHEAPGTVAFQANRNIKLSEGAWAESVPNLDIETNDVKCSHASAVGPIDEDQRFYLESRGVPPSIAERLIVLGFFDEVLLQLPVPGAVEPLRRTVADKLERRDR
jgi:Fe-S cluster assembly protein SufD